MGARRLTLRAIAGLLTPDSGRIVLNGRTLFDSEARVNVRPQERRVAYLFQDYALFPHLTVAQNIAFGLERGWRNPRRNTHHPQAQRWIDAFGLGAITGNYPGEISGGQKQRAALARALVNEPRLLILDEPLGKLDSLTRLSMQGELVSLWQRSRFTALLVTHDVEEALLLATRVIVFSERPARITAEIKIDRDYPRHRDDPELIRLRREILGLLGLGQGW